MEKTYERKVEQKIKSFIVQLVGLILLIVGAIIATTTILNSDMPDIWKWILLR